MLEQNDAALAPADDAPMDLDTALAATWDEGNAEPTTEEPEREPEVEAQVNETPDSEDEPQAVEEQPEAEPAVELPSDLPVALKEHWSALPSEAREAVESAHREMAQKVGDKARELQRIEGEYQGIIPLRDELAQVVQEFPAFSHMTPAQAAAEMRQLATYSRELDQNPVGALAFLAQEYGVGAQLAQLFNGQVPTETETPALKQELAAVKRELATYANPEMQRQQFDHWSQQSRTLDAVSNFAAGAEHWADLEADIPTFIPVAQRQLGEGAAPEAVLETAYKLAINTLMPDKAPLSDPAPEAKPEPDPKKVEQALKAKSVNVSGKTTGRTSKMTLEDELARIHDRAFQS